MIHSLHYGTITKPLALVRPDARWDDRGMFRIHWPNGEVSDMVNLSRAKDAARLRAMRLPGLPSSNRTMFKWKVAQSLAEASPMRQNERAGLW